MKNFLFPETASTVATEVDALYFGLVAMSVFFIVVVAGAIVYLSIKYRRRRPGEVGIYQGEVKWLEYLWTGVPIVLGVVFFIWGVGPYLKVREIPENAMEVAVVGRQWMWKFQHPDGRREINELHVPVGRPIHLKMISQDVIHSLFVPAFRIKQDVLPMYYTSIWFEATKVGSYRLLCTEYCGKDHSVMTGWVHVMNPEAYDEWLASDPQDKLVGAAERRDEVASPSLQRGASQLVRAGHELFQSLQCATCHQEQNLGTGPSLIGIAGSRVQLDNGRVVVADDNYLRESILNPAAKVVKGYAGIMPAFRGRVSEEELLALIAYIKSLRSPR